MPVNQLTQYLGILYFLILFAYDFSESAAEANDNKPNEEEETPNHQSGKNT